jgi:hypothetical protein
LGNTIRGRLFYSGKEERSRSERTMERIFEADTREEANRNADEWWSKTPAGFHSNPSKQWVIAIHYKEGVSPS